MPGYKAVCPEAVEKRLNCEDCKLLLRCAVQLTRDGTLLCESCYEQREGNADQEVFPDKARRREVRFIKVHCDDARCSWTGNAGELEAHCTSCPYTPQPCRYCRGLYPAHRLEEHVKHCSFRRVPCECCGYETAINLMDFHMLFYHQSVISNADLDDLRYRFDAPVSPQLPLLPEHTIHMAPIPEESRSSPSDYVSGLHSSEGYQPVLDARLTDLEKKIEELQKEQEGLKTHASELEMQLQASLASTHNGSFLWRIPDVSRRRRDAINERITSIYSPPFYTGHNGYKMCIRAYLNGDGSGHTTHLSLFFVLMKGEYDPLLKWPFDYKVSMILVDQNRRKHLVQTFKPTPESSSFQRPQTDMNVASGCPQFAKLSVLDDEDYVKENVMYIKCIVDTSRIFHP